MGMTQRRQGKSSKHCHFIDSNVPFQLRYGFPGISSLTQVTPVSTTLCRLLSAHRFYR